MSTPTPPTAVKLFVALLFADTHLLTQAVSELEVEYGQRDCVSTIFPWDTTDYYQREMGGPLLRQFYSFERLIEPTDLVACKLHTNDLEHAFASPPGASSPRRVNIDPGYIDTAKLVLASTKGQAHRLYLSQGIYAEITLLYHHRAYHVFPYTYMDYQWPETQAFLKQVRRKYLELLRHEPDTR